MSAADTASAAAPSPNKKRRFVPPAVAPNLATAADLRVLHQKINLSTVLVRSTGKDPQWHFYGSTVLYVVDEAPEPSQNIALHLRGFCVISALHVECPAKITPPGESVATVGLTNLPVSYQHADPLMHVLLKPPSSYTEDDITNLHKDADAQCSRGAQGMMTGLRVASVASNMGELRMMVSHPNKPKIRIGQPKQEDEPTIVLDFTLEEARTAWHDDLVQNDNGSAVRNLQTELWKRSEDLRQSRIKRVSDGMAEATVPTEGVNKIRAMKITVNYELPIHHLNSHLAGIHVHANNTPHIYTTAGVVGDHEGTRSWLPCLDSANTRHRASREITIMATAPVRDGILVVGCGEDFGARAAYLHDQNITEATTLHLGDEHVGILKRIWDKEMSIEALQTKQGSLTHVIPPDQSNNATIDSILATSVYCSYNWTRCPARSLGFAIGPFRILEDPEYFSIDDNEGPAQDERRVGQETLEVLEMARSNGEGIRQAYFAPLCLRKHIHKTASMTLLPDAKIILAPLTRKQKEIIETYDEIIITSTVGVPHRALSLLRDVLALPAYRTAAYTQIWIPNAVHGGSSSGALHCCADVLVNPFLGGAIMDSRLLPPPGHRLPFHAGGRVLQFLQARCAIRGWITAALPLGGRDDVGFGYIFSLVESFLMSLYERGHGSNGEGGAKGGVFYNKRYALSSGLNSPNLEFLPLNNVEEIELDPLVAEMLGAVPIEDRNNDQMWRTATNGTESHTSSMDEFSIRQLLFRDSVEALERGDKYVPLPSPGWLGSHLSLSFLSSNSTSSSEVGCGAVELAHPVGGLVYRALKGEVLRRIVEGRAGVANFIRFVRAGFIAAHLEDVGQRKLNWDDQVDKKRKKEKEVPENSAKEVMRPSKERPSIRPSFVVCVDELMRKKGFTHNLWTRALRILAGPIREPNLRGTLVDVEREVKSTTTQRQFVEPEGFPNSFVRGASQLYLRVGAHVEQVGETAGNASGAGVKGIQLHLLSEPVIPEGGISFDGPITVRVVENEGQLREFVRTLSSDGSRCEWGPIFLHAKPVTTARQQTAASGAIEPGTASTKDGKEKVTSGNERDTPLPKSLFADNTSGGVFTEALLHCGGYQAIELVRLTNRTPLLWVRVDPMGLFCGRISVFQPDACLAEQLFHDGDAGAQVDAIRSLAERPLRIQGSVKIAAVFDAHVAELPVRLLGDCLRGSPALCNALPHTPAVRVQAAYAIAQWQNNKAPASKDSTGAELWLGVNLLIQYFNERFNNNGIIVPIKFNRIALKKNEEESRTAAGAEGGAGQGNAAIQDEYHYLDSVAEEDKISAILEAEEIDTEEDEEYRVRSAVVTAISSVRAKDGMTPKVVLQFLEAVLNSGDASMVGTLETQEEDEMLSEVAQQRKKKKDGAMLHAKVDVRDGKINSLTHVSSMILADALLCLCNINVSPDTIIDPITGNQIQSKAKHPVTSLLESSRRWLEWELYRESIRLKTSQDTLTGVGGGCHDAIAACAIIALSSLNILRQCTTDASNAKEIIGDVDRVDPASTAQFYINIFDEKPCRSDVTRAAAAQAVACVCCAADRDDDETTVPLGLLTSFEFLINRILGKLAYVPFCNENNGNAFSFLTPPSFQIQAYLLDCDKLLHFLCSTLAQGRCVRCNEWV